MVCHNLFAKDVGLIYSALLIIEFVLEIELFISSIKNSNESTLSSLTLLNTVRTSFSFESHILSPLREFIQNDFEPSVTIKILHIALLHLFLV